jgi:hypothetical protein
VANVSPQGNKICFDVKKNAKEKNLRPESLVQLIISIIWKKKKETAINKLTKNLTT